jgi:hypothetical protein
MQALHLNAFLGGKPPSLSLHPIGGYAYEKEMLRYFVKHSNSKKQYDAKNLLLFWPKTNLVTI